MKNRRLCMAVKSAFFLIAIIILFSTAICCYGQDPGDSIRMLTGSVTDKNWVGQKLTVKTNAYGVPDEITFFVPDHTKCTRGAAEVSFSDVNISDRVTVEYYSSMSGLRAVHINVKR